MPDQDTSFPPLVSLAAHDLRTPLATIYGFARTIERASPGPDALEHYVAMIVAAAEEMTVLLEEVSLAARIESARYDPSLAPADTLELAREGVPDADGVGATVATDVTAVPRALGDLARCARKHGGVENVSVHVDGPVVTISPVNEAARPVILGEQLKDLGAAVATRVLRALGAEIQLDGETLSVRFAAGSGS
jgi:signal transduction histidine kinase